MSGSGFLDAFYLSTPGGDRFCIFRAPSGKVRGAVLHVHAFAEEMNRARRSIALQSVALARCGYAVLSIDLAGCGDSTGELADVSWGDWLVDVQTGLDWLRARHSVRTWLWTLRAGALVAVEAVRQGAVADGLLMVQPPASGQQVLRQFLRLRSAMSLSGAREAFPQDPQKLLASGGNVEVAGYLLGSRLAEGLSRSTMDLDGPPLRIARFVVGAGMASSSAAAAMLERWQQAGHRVTSTSIDLPPFWQTGEHVRGADLVRGLSQAMELE